MERHDDLLGVVVETLANHQHCLPIAVAIGVRKGDIGGQGYVTGHLLPQEPELVA